MPLRMDVSGTLEVPEDCRLICFKPFAFMFAKWMWISSVIYVCHYIFLHLFVDLTEINECSQGQSSVQQSLPCKSVSHSSPHIPPPGDVFVLHSPHCFQTGPDFLKGQFQRRLTFKCTLKLHSLHSPGPYWDFRVSGQSLCCSWTCIIPHTSLRSKLSLLLYLFKIWTMWGWFSKPCPPY